MRIVSGGQTGVDRGALDAAIAAGLECGGWCAADRLAEDGTVPEHYPLRPAPRPGYAERTVRNVLDSDGTLIIYYGALAGGTEETLLRCLQLNRPYRLVDAREISAKRAGELGAEFVLAHALQVLNVAGPRTSEWTEAYGYSRDAVSEVCRRIRARE